MKNIQLPNLLTLNSCFILVNGALVWRQRPKEHFSSTSVWKWWNSKYAGKPAGRASAGYLSVGIDGSRYLTHRIIFFMNSGVDPGVREVDHKDTNKLNNNPANLRIAIKDQNQHNSALRLDNKSGVKGVSWYQKNSCWVAQLRNCGKRHSAYFQTVEEAEAWIKALRISLHGEFARHGSEKF